MHSTHSHQTHNMLYPRERRESLDKVILILTTGIMIIRITLYCSHCEETLMRGVNEFSPPSKLISLT